MNKILSAVVVAACAGLAQAQFAVNVASSNSVDAFGNALNGVNSFVYGGPSTIFSSMRIQGTLTSGGTGSYASEARWGVGNTTNGTPAQTSIGYRASSLAATFTTLNLDTTITGVLQWANPGDTFRYETFESFNDPGTDAVWTNTTLTYSGTAAFTNVGSYLPGTFSFDTETSGFDTELALFSSNGTLIAQDDDGGTGLLSLISGQTLGMGTYYLVAAGFNAYFFNGVALPGTATGNLNVQINGVNVSTGALAAGALRGLQFDIIPAPGALTLAGVGMLAAARRRR